MKKLKKDGRKTKRKRKTGKEGGGEREQDERDTRVEIKWLRKGAAEKARQEEM